MNQNNIIKYLLFFTVNIVAHPSFFKGYAEYKRKQDSKYNNTHHMFYSLRDITNECMQQYKLANSENIKILIQNKFSLIKDTQKKEATAIFETPTKPQSYILSESEVEKTKTLFVVKSIESKGQFKVVKFQYFSEELLPENQEQAILLLYKPYLKNLLVQENLTLDELNDYLARCKNPLNDKQKKFLLGKRKELDAKTLERQKKALMKQIVSKAGSYKEGFLGSTIIKTDTGYKKIADLKIGDTVICYDREKFKKNTSKITNINRQRVPKHIQITIDGKILQVAQQHKFYVESYDTWITAQELHDSPHLRELVDSKIQNVQEVNQPLDVLNVTIDSNHNFYITEHNILVHNFSPEIIITVGEALLPIIDKVTYSLISGGILYLGWQQMKRNHPEDCSQKKALDPFVSPIPGLVETLYPQIFENSKQQNSQKSSSDGIFQEKSKENNSANKQSDRQQKSASSGSQQPSKDPDDKDKKKNEPNGRYEDAPYHHKNSKGKKSPAPKDGQKALDNSVQIKETSPHRVSVSGDEFIVLKQTSKGLYHGYSSSWENLEFEMQKALINAGLVTSTGKIK